MGKKAIDWSNLGFAYQATDKRYVSDYKNGAWDAGGLTADDVLDVGGGDLPLPGDDAPEAIPEVESAPEFYAPPVPDAAMTIAQEMDNAIQP